MKMSKIAVCYFSYHKDVDFLNESLKVLDHTIKKHSEHEVRVYVFDDGRCDKSIKKKELFGKPTLIKTSFDRMGNLNGYDCIDGMFKEYKKISEKFDYDYLVKLDSDCCLNSFEYIKRIEDFFEEHNMDVKQLSQFGSYFIGCCVYGCCQTFGKIGVAAICNLFNTMNNPTHENAIMMKKRVVNGFNEDKVVSFLLEMSPTFKANIDAIPNLKGHCNAFTFPQDTDYSQFTSVAFKPNYFIPIKDWTREKSLEIMKNYATNFTIP